jgi:DNA-directed RNA polymerase subunit N (RpoN/RPB10)
MSSFILCPECGENLGEVYEFINVAKQGFYKSDIPNILKKENPEKIEITSNVTKPIGFIMDAVGITNICCRTHVLGVTNFNTIHK